MFTGKTSDELDIQVSSLYANRASQLKVTAVSLQQQRGGADCGVFALTVATTLAFGKTHVCSAGGKVT